MPSFARLQKSKLLLLKQQWNSIFTCQTVKILKGSEISTVSEEHQKIRIYLILMDIMKRYTVFGW